MQIILYSIIFFERELLCFQISNLHKSKLNSEIFIIAFFHDCDENFYPNYENINCDFNHDHILEGVDPGLVVSLSLLSQTANTKHFTLRKCGMFKEYKPREYLM